MRIIDGDLEDPRVAALLRSHLANARAHSSPGASYALDLAGLRSSDISFWAIWDDEALVGVGALKRLSAGHGEIKSMHTAEAMRGKGVGRMMLRHIIAAARARGMTRLSLETGTWPYFLSARKLYLSYGFVECPPFADYPSDPSSFFMTLELAGLST